MNLVIIQSGLLIYKSLIIKDLREIRRRNQLATLGELAVGLGHRINNPLEVIFNNLDVLTKHMAQSFSDEEYVVQEERVESIQRELVKIRGIVSRIDDMAHGERYDTTEYLHGSRMADLGGDDVGSPGSVGVRPATQALAGLRLLVVDDDLGVCYSLRDVLEEEGCSVEVATNGLVHSYRCRTRCFATGNWLGCGARFTRHRGVGVVWHSVPLAATSLPRSVMDVSRGLPKSETAAHGRS